MEQYNNLRGKTVSEAVMNEKKSTNNKSREFFFRKICFGLLAAVIIFTGCNKDDNGKNKEEGGNEGLKIFEISIENGKEYNSKIDMVKLISYNAFDEYVVLASADYNDGNFILNLPATIEGGFWVGFGGNISETVTVSDPNALIAIEIAIVGFKGDNRVCWFYYENEDESAYGFPVYVNSDLSINGTLKETYDRDITYIEEYNYNFSINAKRGWNMWYTIENDEIIIMQTTAGIKEIYNSEMTTTDPGGLKWNVEFRDYYYRDVTAGEELKINAQVENGNTYNNYIRRVRADGYYYPLAVGTYSNGSFSLTIPNTISYDNLGWIGNYFNNHYCYESDINISNNNVRIMSFDRIRGYSSIRGTWDWNDYVGDFIFGKTESNSVINTMYMFVDNDVNVTGTCLSYYNDYRTEYLLNLKAGWNTVYLTVNSSGNRIISTTSVSGLKWYFEYDYYRTLPFNVMRLTNNILNGKGTNSRIFSRIFNNPTIK